MVVHGFSGGFSVVSGLTAMSPDYDRVVDAAECFLIDNDPQYQDWFDKAGIRDMGIVEDL